MSKIPSLLFATVAVGIVGASWFIWPTPYRNGNLYGQSVRISRFTGCATQFTSQGWVTVSEFDRCASEREKQKALDREAEYTAGQASIVAQLLGPGAAHALYDNHILTVGAYNPSKCQLSKMSVKINGRVFHNSYESQGIQPQASGTFLFKISSDIPVIKEWALRSVEYLTPGDPLPRNPRCTSLSFTYTGD